jgi:hypothetical protein
MTREEILKQFDKNQEILRLEATIIDSDTRPIPDFVELRKVFIKILDKTKAKIVMVTRPYIVVEKSSGNIIDNDYKWTTIDDVNLYDQLTMVSQLGYNVDDIVKFFDAHEIIYFYVLWRALDFKDSTTGQEVKGGYLVRYNTWPTKIGYPNIIVDKIEGFQKVLENEEVDNG